MTHAAEPSAKRRRLGRSRHYTQADLPGRLLQWHAPRANRWERLCVDAGPLAVAWLGDDGVASECLRSGDARWIAPGTRWRIARLDAGARFRLEIFADDASAAGAPQPLRAALLDAAETARIDDEAALARLLEKLRPGTRRIVRANFDFGAALRKAIAGSGGTLCWHPLEVQRHGAAALVARSPRAIGLAEYLGRDHAVLEAALAGALRGDAERATWLRNVLARHLVIEEVLLFPAYLEAGGNAGWVRGLGNEHKHLRHHVDHLSAASSQRRLLLLLDGHDEKEEQIVYPDILARLGHGAEILGRQAMQLNAP